MPSEPEPAPAQVGYPRMTRNTTLATAAAVFGLLAATSFAIGWIVQILI